MSNPFNNRSEILFIYEAKWANPNGDPLDENKPRIDEETEKCIVTDVRLKRTIRDEWQEWGETLWVSGESVRPGEKAKVLGIKKGRRSQTVGCQAFWGRHTYEEAS